MINLSNYELFVDKRTSKNGKDYYALYLKVGDKEEMICFIHKNVYDYILDLSS